MKRNTNKGGKGEKTLSYVKAEEEKLMKILHRTEHKPEREEHVIPRGRGPSSPRLDKGEEKRSKYPG